MLEANAKHGDGIMEIRFTGTALTVYINGKLTYHDADAGLTPGQFILQSHWGSGVVFENLTVQQP